jgi:hypothetical protein
MVRALVIILALTSCKEREGQLVLVREPPASPAHADGSAVLPGTLRMNNTRTSWIVAVPKEGDVHETIIARCNRALPVLIG